MPLISGGQLVLSDTVRTFTPTTYGPSDGINLAALFSTYGAIYKAQLWVYVVVRKRALATRRLPFKTYRRTSGGREDARDTPLATLLRQPNRRHSGAFLWEWTSSTFDTYGEAIWLKVRGRDGRPIELWPVHPTNVVVEADGNKLRYLYGPGLSGGANPQFVIPEEDAVHFRSYNPDSTVRGLSPLEPLRQTLVNEDAARRANSALWRNGARPSMFMTHPGKLSDGARTRLAASWASVHGGVDNFAKTAILEEGMKPEVVSLSAEELQYIESRRLNREEVCGAYDMPPPAVHILDRATFSNITEQFRSVYRDTMAPHLGGFESTLAFQLTPEFGDDLYQEFLMDEVLRGDFEQRVTAYQAGIQSGWLTPAEVREMENLPAIEGADRLLVNGALTPVGGDNDPASPKELAEIVQKVYLGVGKVLTADEARAILDRAGAQLGDAPPDMPQIPTGNALNTLMGRLGRVDTLADVDPETLTAGLNGHTDTVLTALADAIDDGETVAEFRTRLRAAFSS